MALNNQHLLEAFSRDRALAASVCFKHRHANETPAFHIEIHDAWRSADEFVLIEAFREAGKSTIAEEFIALEACFENFRYLILGGETYTKACQRLEAIKYELCNNTKLYNLFGDMRASKAQGQAWNEGFIELRNGVVIQAFGWEQEVRGWKHHDARPDRCYLDDIENRERVRDEHTVHQNIYKLFTEVLPAMDKLTRKIRVTGTPLAHDCMISRLRQAEHWTHFFYPICNGPIEDDTTKSLWPERYPMSWIRKEYNRYAEMGMTAEFKQEYMLVAAQTVGKPFTESDLVFMDTAPQVFMRRAVILDPARTTDQKNAETGHVEVGQLGKNFYVFASGGDSWQPSEQVDYAFFASSRNADCKVAIEQDGLSEWLHEPLRTAMVSRGTSLDVKGVNAPKSTDKKGFITGLQAYFKAKSIILVGNRSVHAKLVAQILNFPSGKVDVLNALAFIQKVFAGAPVYPEFSSVNVVYDTEAGRNDQLWLAINADARMTVAALLSVSGQSKIVMNDWAAAVSPHEAVRDIVAVIRSLYPSKKLMVSLPADTWDQGERLPLKAAVRALGLEAYRGGYMSQSQGCLSADLRTELRGRRLFCVDHRATYTLNALAGDYATQFGKDGRAEGAPESGSARLLMSAIECLTHVLGAVQNTHSLPADMPRAVTKGGQEYLTMNPRN